MTRSRRATPARRSAQPRERRPSPPRSARRWWTIAAGLAVVAAVAWLTTRGSRTRPPSAPPAPISPLADVAPQDAYVRALQLGRIGRHFESLPYFRRGLEGIFHDHWAIHHNYAAALNNAAYQPRNHYGLGGPIVRSSYDRVAMEQEAFRQLKQAERVATEREVVATISIERGHGLEFFGFPWDAMSEYQHALAADPGSQRAKDAIARCLASQASTRPTP